MPHALLVLALLVLTPACSLLKVYEFHDPLTAKEHLSLGVSYESEGKPQSAIAEYEKVAAMDPHGDGVTARVFLGNVYAGLEQFQQAEQSYRDALSLNPRQSQALNNLAVLYAKQGIKLDEAESLAHAALAQAAEQDPGRQGMYLETLGEVLLRQERYAEALQRFQQAEALSANGQPYWLVQLYTNMADAYQGLGQTAEAQHARDRAATLQRETRSSL